MALLLAMANLFYRDVKYLFEVVITVWMFATIVLYPMTGVGGTLGTLLSLNPMTPIIDAYRDDPAARRAAGRDAVRCWRRRSRSPRFALGVACCFHRAEFQFAENV